MRKMEHRTLSEEEWDAYLRIHTCGREDYQEDQAHFPYEPTPYIVLEKLCESGYLTSKDKLLDYGCGFLSFRSDRLRRHRDRIR